MAKPRLSAEPRMSVSRSTGALLAALLVAVLIVTVANLPTTTEISINFVPQTRTQPLYAKFLAFVHRDVEMSDLSRRIVAGAADAEEKAERILLWTRTNVVRTPAGMPIIDDHPHNVVTRGYGEPDQIADVFATLAAYAGMPGGLTFSRAPDGHNYYAFAVIRINDADRVFDVIQGLALRGPSGQLADLDKLRSDPASRREIVPAHGANGVSYAILIEELDEGPHRRATQHMLLHRLFDEVHRLIGRRN